jgi:hypothetical protein
LVLDSANFLRPSQRVLVGCLCGADHRVLHLEGAIAAAARVDEFILEADLR